MNYRIIYNDELYHHGVKGMKWGVRKAANAVSRMRQAPHLAPMYDRFGRPTTDIRGNRVKYDRNGRMKMVDPPMDTLRNADRQARKTSATIQKAAKAVKAGAKVAKAKLAANAKKSYSESLRGKAAKLGAKAVGKSYKVNESVERKKSAVASKVGLKKVAQTHANNADYYKKTSKDLQSGKVGRPHNKYQKAMQALGRSKFATKAIVNSKDLNAQTKAHALAEQALLREDYRQRKAKRG